MKIKITIILLLITTLGFSKKITLKDAIKSAIKNNPELKSTDADYKSSTWQKAGAIYSALPSVSLTAMTTHNLEESQSLFPGMPSYKNNGSYGVSLSQPIFMGGKILTGYKIADIGKKMKKILLDSKEKQIKNDVSSKYNKTLEQHLIINIAEKQLKTAKDNFKIAQVKYDSGILSKASYLQIKLSMKNAEVNLLNQKSLLKLYLNNLNNAIGETEQYDVIVKADVRYKQFSQVIKKLSEKNNIPANLIRLCTKDNYQIKLSKSSTKLSGLSHRLSYGNFLPTVGLSYSKTWSSSWNSFKDAEFDPSSSYGVNFSMPLFPIVNNFSDYKKTLWNYKKAKYDTQNTKNQIVTLLKNTYWQFITLYTAIETSNISLEYGDEMYKSAEERFKNSLISSNDFLSAKVAKENSEYNYVKTVYQFYEVKNNLKLMLDLENDGDLIKILTDSEDK